MDRIKINEPTLPKMTMYLDSGAHSFFTLHNRGKPKSAWTQYYKDPEYKAYLESYIEFLHKYKHLFHMYVTLDVIREPKATWETIKYIESCGLKPVPVIHVGTDHKYLFKYLDNYDYICLGGLGQHMDRHTYIQFGNYAFQQICDSKGVPRIKVHGLAMTGTTLMGRWPWYSVDSKSWVSSAAYGNLMLPNSGRVLGKYDFTNYKNLLISNRRTHDNRHILKMPKVVQEVLRQYAEWAGVDYDKLEGDFVERAKLNAVTLLGTQAQLDVKWRNELGIQGTRVLFAGNPMSEPSRFEALKEASRFAEKELGTTTHVFETFFHTKLVKESHRKKILSSIRYRASLEVTRG